MKEVHYFDSHLDKGVEWYLEQIPDVMPDELAFEKTAKYFITPNASVALKALNPNVKILLAVRDPTQRTYSCYFQRLSRMMDGPGSFESKVFMSNGEVNCISQPCWREVKIFNLQIDEDYYCVNVSLYHNHMEQWLQTFPRDQIHLVDGERLIKKPWYEIDKIIEFLGLEFENAQDKYVYSEDRGFFCLDDGLGHGCLPKNKGRTSEHGDMDRKTRRRLEKFFDPHNQVFFNQVGREFKWG